MVSFWKNLFAERVVSAINSMIGLSLTARAVPILVSNALILQHVKHAMRCSLSAPLMAPAQPNVLQVIKCGIPTQSSATKSEI